MPAGRLLLMVSVLLTLQSVETVKFVPRYIYDKVEHSPVYHETMAVYENDGTGGKLGLVRTKRDPAFHRKAQGKMRLVASGAHLNSQHDKAK